MSTQDLYDSAVRPLPAMERLRLASLILNGLAGSKGQELDIRDHWDEQDMSDLATFSAKHAEIAAAEENSHA